MTLMNVDGDLLNAGMRATADAIRAMSGASGPINWDQANGTGFAGAVGSLSPRARKLSLTLPASWSAGNPHSMTVTIEGVGALSKIDLQADAATITQMITDGTETIYIVNNNGVCTAYATGDAPSVALTVQCTITNVDDGDTQAG